jgi:hypothetical protein
VFKALFNRTKDWADIEAMAEVGALDVTAAVASVRGIVGSEDPVVRRMASLAS